MNVPNFITISRLLIAIISFVLMFLDFWLLAFVLLLIAVLLDTVDGRVSRKLHQETVAGGFLDIMSDKIVIIATFIIIGYKINVWFLYIGLLMLIREYSMDTMRSIASIKNVPGLHINIKADKFSKIKGVMFMIVMLVVIGNQAFFDGNEFLNIIMIALGLITIIISYFTLLRIYSMNKSVFS